MPKGVFSPTAGVWFLRQQDGQKWPKGRPERTVIGRALRAGGWVPYALSSAAHFSLSISMNCERMNLFFRLNGTVQS